MRVGIWRTGDVIDGKYEVTRVLGQGGMGLVYLVRHLGWGIDLAVKSPLPERFTTPEDVDRFVAEAKTWVSLSLHPAVCACHYVRVLDGIPRLFAEYVPGGTLHERISDRTLYAGTHDEAIARILRSAIHMARGLEHAHSQGVLHLDVKPENVLLETGDPGGVKITDFGLAKVTSTSGSGGGAMSRPYASPEQIERRAVNLRSDVYSFAVSVLEMFTGGVTWPSGSVAGEALAELLRTGPLGPDLPPLPRALADLLESCLSEQPEDRPESMGSVATELEDLYRTLAPGAPAIVLADSTELRPAEHNNRALSLLDLGDRGAAEMEFRAALGADPRHPDATYNYGLLRWRAGEITDEDLLTLLSAAGPGAGDSWQARYMIAQVHLERGDTDHARECLDDLTRAHSAKPEVQEATRALESGVTGHIGIDRTVRAEWYAVPKSSYDKVKVCFTSDGSLLIAAGGGHPTRLWDTRTGECLHRACTKEDWPAEHAESRFIALDSRLREPKEQFVRQVASADGSQALVVTALWERHRYKVWHTDHRAKASRLIAELDSYVRTMAFTPDGAFAVIASDDHRISVYNLRSGECERQITSTAGSPMALAFSGDGRWLLSAGDAVRLWDFQTGRCLRTLRGHAGASPAAWISADGRSGLSAGFDNMVRWWSLRPASGYQAPLQLSTPRPTLEVSRLSAEVRELVSRSVQAVTAGNYGTAHKLLSQARSVPGHERDTRTLQAWRALGSYLPRTGLRGAWTTRVLSGQGAAPSGAYTVSISADARVAASAHGSRAYLWDLQTGMVLGKLPVIRMADGVDLSPDGQQVVVGMEFGHVGVFSVQTGEELHALKLPYSGIPGADDGISVAFTGDAKRVLLGSENGTILVWDLQSRRRIRTPSGHKRAVKALWASADGRTFASAARDSIRVWDLSNGQCFREIPAIGDDPPKSVCVSPDGELILATWLGAPSMTLWNAAGECVLEVADEQDAAPTARFSPDGRFIFAGTKGGAITVWDTRTVRLVNRIDGHQDGVWDIRLTPDGHHALSAGYDGTMRLWELDWELAAPYPTSVDSRASDCVPRKEEISR